MKQYLHLDLPCLDNKKQIKFILVSSDVYQIFYVKHNAVYTHDRRSPDAVGPIRRRLVFRFILQSPPHSFHPLSNSSYLFLDHSPKMASSMT